MPEENWRKTFRMTQEMFYELMEELRPYIDS